MKAAYTLLRKLMRGAHHVRGSMPLRRFGVNAKILPTSEHGESLWFHYPGSPRQRIVAYADFVQWHSLVATLDALPPGVVVVEVGAHHGIYATVLGEMVKRKGGRFVAVEASPSNAAILRKNLQLNQLDGTVEVEEVFISDESTTGFVGFSEQGAQSIMSDAPDAIQVRSESVRSMLKRLGITHIDILLVDIEGAEAQVMPAFPWAEVSVGKIYCELHPGEWHKFGGAEKFERMLRDQGFICLDMYQMTYDQVKHQHYVGPATLIRRSA